jgi:hypothetical protein
MQAGLTFGIGMGVGLNPTFGIGLRRVLNPHFLLRLMEQKGEGIQTVALFPPTFIAGR